MSGEAANIGGMESQSLLSLSLSFCRVMCAGVCEANREWGVPGVGYSLACYVCSQELHGNGCVGPGPSRFDRRLKLGFDNLITKFKISVWWKIILKKIIGGGGGTGRVRDEERKAVEKGGGATGIYFCVSFYQPFSLIRKRSFFVSHTISWVASVAIKRFFFLSFFLLIPSILGHIP